MTYNVKNLTTEQKSKLDAELAKRGVKFLPVQAMRRIVDPSPQLVVLGASARAKVARVAKQQAAQKAAPAAPAPVSSKK